MKKLSKLTVAALALLLAAGTIGTPAAPVLADDAVTFTVTADVTGDRAPYVEEFASLIEEKTEGRYKANVIAAGSLGTGADAAQMLQMGSLDILMSDDMTMDGVLDGKLGLNKIAARWPARAVAQFYFIDK